jgi:hypothetical protein
MGLFGRRRREEIVLEFLDADSGRPLYRTDSLPADLPDSFRAPQSVQIQGVEHDVVRAVPADAAEFRRTRRLKLWVRKRVFVPLNRLLFSLPTISDRLPAAATAPGGGRDLLVLPADGWRQVEFVSAEQRSVVEAELASVREVLEGARAEAGWSRIHLRRGPACPLGRAGLPLQDLRRRFRTDVRRYDGVVLKGEPGAVEDGFALETGSLLVLYGRAAGDQARELGLLPRRGGEADAAVLASLARDHGLLLVDWCRAQLVPADAEAIARRLQDP